MKTILLTGANGFLGKSILKQLARNHSLVSLSRTIGDYRLSLEKEIPNFNEKFDLVIHAAGKAHSIPKTEDEKKQFYDVNVIRDFKLIKRIRENVEFRSNLFLSVQFRFTDKSPELE